ncbi:class A sortase [Brochothrix thermosphacta]|uniref:class A sortase n=1 Tax=Brochothrix thermosphacta TaxID=2756 RepID=UPI00246802D7|nr:class A sortase [Brochothrix thermosphacta]
MESVDMHLPILKGTNDRNLLFGATTMFSKQKMGEGNYSLAGHHMEDDNILFGPLTKIKYGAEITLTDKVYNYHYEVLDMEIVSESKVSILEDKEDNRLTLFTCDLATETNKRFVVSAKFIKKIRYEKKDN